MYKIINSNSGVWESQKSWWDGFALSPASPAKDTFPGCRWPVILVARGGGAGPWVPGQCRTAPSWWKLYLGALAAAPLPASSFWDRAQAASGKEGARRRGIPGQGLALPQQHPGPLRIQEKGWSSTIFSLHTETQPIFNLWPSHTSVLWAVAQTNWLSQTQTETPWFQHSCWQLPGATFPAFVTPHTSLDAGGAQRAAGKQRLLPGPPRGSKQHINPLWDLARTGDSQWLLWTLLPKYHTFRRLHSWCTVSSWRAAGTVTEALENELIVRSSLDVTIILMRMDFFLGLPPIWMGSTETSPYLWDFN